MRIILLFILIFPIAFGAITATAQEEEIVPIQAPETIEEAQEFGLQILKKVPEAMQEVWRTKALPIWSNMWNTTKNIWDTTVFSFVERLWNQTLSFFGQEIEKRRPLIEEEFQREKEELKQELQKRIPDPKKTLWNYIKGFLPGNEEK